MSIEADFSHVIASVAEGGAAFPCPMHAYGPSFQDLTPGLPDHAVVFKEGRYFSLLIYLLHEPICFRLQAEGLLQHCRVPSSLCHLLLQSLGPPEGSPGQGWQGVP